MEPMLATVPKSTMGATPPLVRLAPRIVTLPEGISGPDAGDTDVSVGAAVAPYVNSLTWSVQVEVEEPAVVDTVTTTWSVAVPAGPAGASALSSPSQLTWTLVAATPPKKTCGVVAVVK